MPVRVMVVDDQHLVREGISSLLGLSAAVEVVGQVNDGSEVIAGIGRFRPDVILLDIRMPGLSGIDALRAMKAAGIAIPAILLTTFDDDELVLQGMQAGARGFLLKDVTLDNLVKAIETVHRGESHFQPVVTEKILNALGNLATGFDRYPRSEDLSGKELEILRLMAGGFSNREIAASIHKSEGTVKNQVSSILGKLGVRDRTRAVLRAIDLGLLG
jgi:DNA-binding NarL/FixJ family response regulator